MSEVLLEREPSSPDIAELNAEFSELAPSQRIHRAAEIFGMGNLALMASFGETSPHSIYQVTSVIPDIPVLTVQNGHQTRETLDATQWYAENFNLNLHIKKVPYVEKPDDENSDEFLRFQYETKTWPMEELLKEHKPAAYFRGSMRWQSPGRANLPNLHEGRNGTVIYPAADVTEAQIETFFQISGLPRNKNHQDPSKGRSGKLECGLERL